MLQKSGLLQCNSVTARMLHMRTMVQCKNILWWSSIYLGLYATGRSAAPANECLKQLANQPENGRCDEDRA
jgi:hypothetical protein